MSEFVCVSPASPAKVSLEEMLKQHPVSVIYAAELGAARATVTKESGLVIVPYDADGEVRFELIECFKKGENVHRHPRQMDGLPADNANTIDWSTKYPWLFKAVA